MKGIWAGYLVGLLVGVADSLFYLGLGQNAVWSQILVGICGYFIILSLEDKQWD